jgi:hypothetical protein
MLLECLVEGELFINSGAELSFWIMRYGVSHEDRVQQFVPLGGGIQLFQVLVLQNRTLPFELRCYPLALVLDVSMMEVIPLAKILSTHKVFKLTSTAIVWFVLCLWFLSFLSSLNSSTCNC